VILSRRAIQQAIEQGKVSIDPYREDAIEAAHINLHLKIPGNKAKLSVPPKGFVIAETAEKITLAEDVCGLMEGKASLARQGISVEQSSTFVEPGSDNRMTLEIFNASDETVYLTPGQPIAKLFLMRVIDRLRA
jgi:dCTP deaminase